MTESEERIILIKLSESEDAKKRKISNDDIMNAYIECIDKNKKYSWFTYNGRKK